MHVAHMCTRQRIPTHKQISYAWVCMAFTAMLAHTAGQDVYETMPLHPYATQLKWTAMASTRGSGGAHMPLPHQMIPHLPAKLGETASAIVRDKLYVVGEGSNETFIYSMTSQKWSTGTTQRPFVGNHHGTHAPSHPHPPDVDTSSPVSPSNL